MQVARRALMRRFLYTTMYRGNDPSDLSICMSMLVICGNLRVGSMSTSSRNIEISTGSLINKSLHDGVRISLATRTGGLK